MTSFNDLAGGGGSTEHRTQKSNKNFPGGSERCIASQGLDEGGGSKRARAAGLPHLQGDQPPDEGRAAWEEFVHILPCYRSFERSFTRFLKSGRELQLKCLA